MAIFKCSILRNYIRLYISEVSDIPRLGKSSFRLTSQAKIVVLCSHFNHTPQVLKRNMSTKINFYRRSLPDSCVAFNSVTGKQYFKDALDHGYMDSYFSLGAQLRTQDEPTFCGLTSLVMVLNAFAVDPGVVWKGVWRWYHEDMLECCTSLEEIKEKGVTLEQLSCIATCNQLESKIVYVTNDKTTEEFRDHVKNCCKGNEHSVIVSFGRKVLQQTGTGHFAPIGGYNSVEDSVLLLEPARFKYPPFWVSLPLLWKSMNTCDKDTGQSRGYMLLKKSGCQPTVLFKLSKTFNVFHSVNYDINKMLTHILEFLKGTPEKKNCQLENMNVLCEKVLQISQEVETASKTFLFTRLSAEKLGVLSPEHQKAIHAIVMEIESSVLYRTIRQTLSSQDYCKQVLFPPDEDISTSACCVKDPCVLCLPHYMTVLFLVLDIFAERTTQSGVSSGVSYQEDDSDKVTYFSTIRDLARRTGDEKGDGESHGKVLLDNEVRQLQQQFLTVLKSGAVDMINICCQGKCSQ